MNSVHKVPLRFQHLLKSVLFLVISDFFRWLFNYSFIARNIASDNGMADELLGIWKDAFAA
jgi:hypothetical protein